MIRRLLRPLLAAYPVRSLIGRLVGRPVTLFMLHRFADPELGTPGHSVEMLRRHLALLRGEGYPIVPLADVVGALSEGGDLPPRAVVFTVDDGYDDFPRQGAPVFKEFDCPVTVFLGSGFLDRSLWYWWDRVDYLIDHADLVGAPLEVPVGAGSYVISDANRSAEGAAMIEALKQLPEEDKLAAIDRLSQIVGVSLPDEAPERYAPMTWDQVRACASEGVTFGPHTVTHPILSRTSDERCAHEIKASWDRVQEETEASIPVFCYPNGDPSSFGIRETRFLNEAGFLGAVSASPGYLRHSPAGEDHLRFALPRFAYSDTDGFLQAVSGVEKMKRVIRGGW